MGLDLLEMCKTTTMPAAVMAQIVALIERT